MHAWLTFSIPREHSDLLLRCEKPRGEGDKEGCLLLERTEKNTIKVVAGHHLVGYELDNWGMSERVGNRQHFSNWTDHQWQLNEDGTLSPKGARHL